MIEFKNVCLNIGEHELLKNINFELEADANNPKHLVIYGPNGAGKTLMVQLLSGNLEPTKGEIKVFGKSLQDEKSHEIKKKIGFVSPKLFDDYDYDFKVSDVVMSGLFGSIGICQDPTKDSNKVVKNYIAKIVAEKYNGETEAIKALEKLHIAHLANENFGHLSYGQKNRVLIARAIITDPELLILDEPTTGLDVSARAEFLEIIKTFTSKTSVVYITHHLEEILPEFKDILMIKSGEIFEFGKKENLMSSEKMSDLLNTSVNIHESEGRYFALF